jgi:hypothetical protein
MLHRASVTAYMNVEILPTVHICKVTARARTARQEKLVGPNGDVHVYSPTLSRWIKKLGPDADRPRRTWRSSPRRNHAASLDHLVGASK